MVKKIIHRPLWQVIVLLFFLVYIILWMLIGIIWSILLLFSLEILFIHVFYFQMSIYPILISLLFRYLWNRFVNVKPSVSWVYKWNDGPWINWINDPKTTMVINWITEEFSDTQILFGDDKSNLKLVVGEPDKIHRVYLEGLIPDINYFYKLVGFSEDESIHNFKTAPEQFNPFSFIVLGDSQNGGGFSDKNWGYPPLIDAINEKSVDFELFFHTGDFTDQGNDIKSWHEALHISSKIAADHPMHLTVGNHDMGSQYLKDNDKSTKKYPDEGANFDYIFGYNYDRSIDESRITSFQSRYYSFDYSNCKFVFVDTQNQKMAEPHSLQWDYLREKFENTPSNMWKIIFQHWPLFERKTDSESGKEYLKLTRYGKFLLPIYDECGVDVIFTGHAHVLSIMSKKYENSDKKFYQIVSGAAGNDLKRNDSIVGEDIGIDELIYFENSTHYLNVDVDKESLVITAFYPDNTLVGNKKIVINKI